jgi:hypothetical protein
MTTPRAQFSDIAERLVGYDIEALSELESYIDKPAFFRAVMNLEGILEDAQEAYLTEDEDEDEKEGDEKEE